jgi:hypothetical protein
VPTAVAAAAPVGASRRAAPNNRCVGAGESRGKTTAERDATAIPTLTFLSYRNAMAGHIPGRVIDDFPDDLPMEGTANPAQRVYFVVPEYDDVLGLERHNEIVAVAFDRYPAAGSTAQGVTVDHRHRTPDTAQHETRTIDRTASAAATTRPEEKKTPASTGQ